MLGQVGLGERLSHYPAQLSGGEQQRVAIARALAPSIPPSSSPTSRPAISTARPAARSPTLLFDAVAERGTTLVLVTHDETLAARCDRTVRIASGADRGGATALPPRRGALA